MADLPLLGAGGTVNIAALPDAVIYSTSDVGVTNYGGVSPAANGQGVMGWRDQTANNYGMLRSAGIGPTNFSSGGPNNAPWLEFGEITNFTSFGALLTNVTGGITFSQPNTFIFVIWDIWRHVTAGGCVLNGYTNNLEQWNWNNGPGENFYAGTDAPFLTISTEATWPGHGVDGLSKWAVVTLQFNGANSVIRINGRQFPVGAPVFYNTGNQGLQGITLGNYNTGTLGAIFGITAFVWLNGTRWTNPSGPLLSVEETLGAKYGLPVL